MFKIKGAKLNYPGHRVQQNQSGMELNPTELCPFSKMKTLFITFLLVFNTQYPFRAHAATTEQEDGGRRVIAVKGGPESVIWTVQLSDLHFSVHHPERASDFKKIVGPSLSMINPSLVLITGDLTGIISAF